MKDLTVKQVNEYVEKLEGKVALIRGMFRAQSTDGLWDLLSRVLYTVKYSQSEEEQIKSRGISELIWDEITRRDSVKAQAEIIYHELVRRESVSAEG